MVGIEARAILVHVAHLATIDSSGLHGGLRVAAEADRALRRMEEQPLVAHLASSPHHEAPCPKCGAAKVAAWLRCGRCESMPAPNELAVCLLGSKRVGLDDDSVSRRILRSDNPALERTLVRVFTDALFGHWTLVDCVRVRASSRPGTVAQAVDPGLGVAAVADFDVSSWDAAQDPRVIRLAEEFCTRLVAHGDVTDLAVESKRAALRRETGATIRASTVAARPELGRRTGRDDLDDAFRMAHALRIAMVAADDGGRRGARSRR